MKLTLLIILISTLSSIANANSIEDHNFVSRLVERNDYLRGMSFSGDECVLMGEMGPYGHVNAIRTAGFDYPDFNGYVFFTCDLRGYVLPSRATLDREHGKFTYIQDGGFRTEIFFDPKALRITSFQWFKSDQSVLSCYF